MIRSSFFRILYEIGSVCVNDIWTVSVRCGVDVLSDGNCVYYGLKSSISFDTGNLFSTGSSVRFGEDLRAGKFFIGFTYKAIMLVSEIL